MASCLIECVQCHASKRDQRRCAGRGREDNEEFDMAQGSAGVNEKARKKSKKGPVCWSVISRRRRTGCYLTVEVCGRDEERETEIDL